MFLVYISVEMSLKALSKRKSSLTEPADSLLYSQRVVPQSQTLYLGLFLTFLENLLQQTSKPFVLT